MPLAEGGAAEGSDFWTRIITNKDHLKIYGLHHSAFGGTAISVAMGRDWSHELSGRLRSLSKDVEDECKAYCERFRRPFIGVMYCQVDALRSKIENCTTDVRYTPIDTPEYKDPAHSDFVIYGSPNDFVLDEIRDWLRRTVKAVRPSDIQVIIDLIPAEPPAGPERV